MNSFNYHGALDVIDDACCLCSGRVDFLRNRLGGSEQEGIHRIGELRGKAMILFRHLSLVLKIRRRRSRLTIVREFSTIPLFLVGKLLGRKKKDVYFIVNHNVQWALHRPCERMALSALASSGIGFVFFEQSKFPELNLKFERVLTIPHPVSMVAPRQRADSRSIPLIGIVGEFRPEKGIDEILDKLGAENRKFDVVLGFPNPACFYAKSRHAHGNWDVQNTAVQDDYLNLLASCDILIICATEKGYKYRASGVIADAISVNTMVVAPDYPVFRHQLTWPTPVGECYGSLSQLDGLIDAMIRNRSNYEDAFYQYRNARSAEVIAGIVNRAGLNE